MIDAGYISVLLLSEFHYHPTQGQKELIGRLSDFLVSELPDTLFILKGFAGTGKTTVVSALVKVLPMLQRKAVLLAPTGRAAKVLAGYSGHQAFTIHRKIYTTRTTHEGNLAIALQENHHRNTCFIVDEASMIQNESVPDEFSFFSSRSLLDDLFFYISQGENCRLILVGDIAQLPPVKQSISHALDPAFLKKAYHFRVVQYELTEVVRQTEDSGILFNATQIRHHITEQLPQTPCFHMLDYNDIRRIGGIELEEQLHTTYAMGGPTDTVVITRSNKRANIYNQEIRNRILYLDSELAAGELLMVVRNNYFWLPQDSIAGFIANGDIIEVMKIKKIEELFGFRYADVLVRLIDYPDQKEFETKILLDTLYVEAAALPASESSRMFHTIMEDYTDLPRKKHRIEKVRNHPYYNALQVKYAYSLTCHKTQGGQWKSVFIDQGYLKDEMITIDFMRWLYTAVTRATERLFLVGFDERFFG